MSRLAISLLGPFHVTLNEAPIAHFRADTARALLAYLVMHADTPLPRSFLAGLLWPDQPEDSALQALRQALSRLRAALGEHGTGSLASSDHSFILTTPQTIQFNPQSDFWFDVTAFDRAIADCDRHAHRHLDRCVLCMRRLTEAVGWYRGDFMSGFALPSDLFEQWMITERERLHGQVLDALYALADYHTRRGEHIQSLACARRHIVLEGWREQAHRQTIRALAAQGQREAALKQYEVCRQVLHHELGVEPQAETTCLYERIRDSDPALVCSPLVSSLPAPLTPFVGREDDLARVEAALQDPACRLLTLVGPGGIGKTRLSLEAALGQAWAFDHGTFWVSLAGVSSRMPNEGIVSAIARAIGLTFYGRSDPRQQLENHIRNKEMLLVLDNIEHLVGETSLLGDLLRVAPAIKMLVTSRVRLNMRCERVFVVEGMAYPQHEADGRSQAIDDLVRDMGRYDAVILFMHEARRVCPGFGLTDESLPYVARVCRLAQGMPLAILLAAAWVAILSPAEIARRMEQSLDFLQADWSDEASRHHSMRAVFDSAWAMLSEQEQEALARLSVFCGGFTQDAAAQVAGADARTLAGLVNKSFVSLAVVDPLRQNHRYEIHELLRQYTVDKLSDANQAAREQMARYYLGYAAAHQDDYARLGPEWTNLMTSLRLAVELGMPREVIGYAEALTGIWLAWGRYAEAQQGYLWASEAAQSLADRQACAHCLNLLGCTHFEQDHFAEADRFLSQSLELCQAIPDLSGIAGNQYDLARVDIEYGRYNRAEERLRSSQQIWEQMGDRVGVARSLYQKARVAYFKSNYDAAQRLGRQAADLQASLHDNRHISLTLRLLADIAYEQGNLSMSEEFARRALEMGKKIQNTSEQALALDTLSHVCRAQNRLDLAQEYARQSLRLLTDTGERRGQAMALYQLSLIQEAMDDPAGALEAGLQSLAICDEVQYTLLKAIVLLHVGDYETKLDRGGQAQVRWQQALLLAESLRHAQLIEMLRQRMTG